MKFFYTPSNKREFYKAHCDRFSENFPFLTRSNATQLFAGNEVQLIYTPIIFELIYFQRGKISRVDHSITRSQRVVDGNLIERIVNEPVNLIEVHDFRSINGNLDVYIKGEACDSCSDDHESHGYACHFLSSEK
jgi:hypothetical protein